MNLKLRSNERQQLVEERDAALEQLRWMEASRNDLARQQGQYKGKIAKVFVFTEIIYFLGHA